ncbi:ester cyclase [Rhizobium mesosinicum]|nr:ester cyclase [Rhizobium mesosinicum]
MVVAATVATGAAANETLTIEQARTIIAPLYDALNQPATKDVDALLRKATTDDWMTCSAEGICLTREKLVGAFKARGETIPDLKWEIRDIMISGNQVIVRGEASGTPAKDFMGVAATGKSFKIMSIDIQTIRGGKIAHSYHIEDWAGAVRQLTGH